jgi:transcriptional regulator with XRE-family HTH domain
MTEQPNTVRRTFASRADHVDGSHEGTPGPVERQFLAEGFGRRLRHLRQRAKLTQAVVAERAGRTREFVSMLERGHRRPEERTVRLLADALGSTRGERAEIRGELRRLAGDSIRQWRRNGQHYVAGVEAGLPALLSKVDRAQRLAEHLAGRRRDVP